MNWAIDASGPVFAMPFFLILVIFMAVGRTVAPFRVLTAAAVLRTLPHGGRHLRVVLAGAGRSEDQCHQGAEAADARPAEVPGKRSCGSGSCCCKAGRSGLGGGSSCQGLPFTIAGLAARACRSTETTAGARSPEVPASGPDSSSTCRGHPSPVPPFAAHCKSGPHSSCSSLRSSTAADECFCREAAASYGDVADPRSVSENPRPSVSSRAVSVPVSNLPCDCPAANIFHVHHERHPREYCVSGCRTIRHDRR